MKLNTSGQAIGAQMCSATDGSEFTGTVTVYVTGDAGTQAIGSVGSGICAHEGHGYHSYLPAQAETNYALIAFTFIGSGAIPATVQVYTTFPQTGDSFARVGAPVGASISADIAAAKVDTAAIKVKTDFLPSATAGASGGLFIAGTNAATTITTGLTANITGNLSGSVGSVTGLTASNLDATISSRMATYTQPTGFLAATFPTTVASTTNITGGTITTVTNLTNAPTAGDFTATMKTSIGTAVAASAVASVTGNVGGNVTGSVGSVASGGITEASFATNAGSFYPLGIVDQGTAQSATGTTLVLRSAAAFANDELIGATIVITGGSTGVGQSRVITDYVSSTDTATVDTWTTTPSGTITYKILATAPGGSGSAPTTAQIADAVWDEILSGHVVSGSTGEALAAAGSAGDPWITALPGAYSAGQAGFILGTNLNGTITSRMATYTQPTGFLAATFPTTVASTTNITAGTITTVTNLTNAPTAGDFTATMKTSIGTAVAASTVASVTGNVGGNVTGSVGSVVGAVGSVTGNVGGNVTGSVGSVVGNVGGSVATVTALAANSVNASALATDAVTEIQSGLATSSALSTLQTSVNDLPTNAELATALDPLPTAAEAAAAFLGATVEGSTTVVQSLRLANAALGGKASGLDTTEATYRDLADTKNRIIGTVDEFGNRTSVTRDLT